MDDFRDAPELVSGDTVADNLVRVIRQIYQVKNRMKAIEVEMATIRESERFSLFLKVEEEKKQGRDFLGQMGARSKTHVAMSLRRLNTLRNLNVAQADYVRDTFGVDIEEFRKKS
jgi:S-adenosylmethionine:tRNA-ribosyltransferase-isomerase (queuine synthetase)